MWQKYESEKCFNNRKQNILPGIYEHPDFSDWRTDISWDKAVSDYDVFIRLPPQM